MEISSKHCKFENLQKMEIVHENADFSGKTDFGNTFCENGNLNKNFQHKPSKWNSILSGIGCTLFDHEFVTSNRNESSSGFPFSDAQ